MEDRIFSSLFALLMLYFTVKQKNIFSIIITTLLSLSILITLVKLPLLISFSILLNVLASMLIVVFAIINRDLKLIERFIIAFTALFVIFSKLFIIMSWPFANELRFLSIIPPLIYLLLFIKSKYKIKPEFGFMMILIAECLSRFLKLVLFWIE